MLEALKRRVFREAPSPEVLWSRRLRRQGRPAATGRRAGITVPRQGPDRVAACLPRTRTYGRDLAPTTALIADQADLVAQGDDSGLSSTTTIDSSSWRTRSVAGSGSWWRGTAAAHSPQTSRCSSSYAAASCAVGVALHQPAQRLPSGGDRLVAGAGVPGALLGVGGDLPGVGPVGACAFTSR